MYRGLLSSVVSWLTSWFVSSEYSDRAETLTQAGLLCLLVTLLSNNIDEPRIYWEVFLTITDHHQALNDDVATITLSDGRSTRKYIKS